MPIRKLEHIHNSAQEPLHEHKDGLSYILEAVLTNRTCAENCWYARESVCRCSCGGRNHGILLIAGKERPPRTKRVKRITYVLDGIAVGRKNSEQYAEELRIKMDIPWIDTFRYTLHTDWGKPCPIAIQAATDQQINSWKELATYKDWKSQGQSWRERTEEYQPFLIWVIRREA